MNLPHNPFAQADGKKPTCMEMLQVIIDGEATDEQQEYFKSHMDRCLPCFKSYDLDMAIKRLLKSRCCGGDAPADLVEQIKLQIGQNTAG
ncbi:MAG: mycothiol system anti-sigma-R factor [Cyclobacteriaceae bacterium]|nr:mycothiol system anti-sigma-R factor [Cyclobacteriaceae bacterium]